MNKQGYIVTLIVIFMLCLLGGAYSLVWYTLWQKNANQVVVNTDYEIMDNKLEEVILANHETLPELDVLFTESPPRYISNAALTESLPINSVKIALIIDDLGMHESIWSELESLPTGITYSYLPYGKYTNMQAKLARKIGHEIMIHLPMEPKMHANGKKIDPGPNALYTTLNENEIIERTNINLSYLKEVSVGVNNHMGSKFSEFPNGLKTVLNIVKNEKMFFLDSVTTGKSAIPAVAEKVGIPFLKRDIFIDHSQKLEDINKMLLKLEKRAIKQGYAVAIGHPHSTTFTALNAWVKTLESKNIVLVPITELLEKTIDTHIPEIAPIKGSSKEIHYYAN